MVSPKNFMENQNKIFLEFLDYNNSVLAFLKNEKNIIIIITKKFLELLQLAKSR